MGGLGEAEEINRAGTDKADETGLHLAGSGKQTGLRRGQFHLNSHRVVRLHSRVHRLPRILLLPPQLPPLPAITPTKSAITRTQPRLNLSPNTPIPPHAFIDQSLPPNRVHQRLHIITHPLQIQLPHHPQRYSFDR